MKRLLLLLTNIEKLSLTKKFIMAWLICVFPRILFVVLFGTISASDLTTKGPFLISSKYEYWYPLYQYFAFICLKIYRGNITLFLTIDILLSSMVGPLVYLLCRYLRLRSMIAWLSVIGVAWLPYYVSTVSKQLQTSLTIPLFALLILLYVIWADKGLPFLYGLIFTAFSFIFTVQRPNALATIIPLYMAAPFFVNINQSSGIKASYKHKYNHLILMSFFVLAMLALAGINKIKTGYFSFSAPTGGLTLFFGNNPYVSEFVWRHDIDSLESIYHYHKGPAALSEKTYENDRTLFKLSLNYMIDNPIQTMKNTIFKAISYWDFRLSNADNLPFFWNIAYTLPYISYIIMAIIGIRLLWRQKQRYVIYLFALIIISYWLPHALLVPTIRYRMTTEFLLIILASVALESFIEKVSMGKSI